MAFETQVKFKTRIGLAPSWLFHLLAILVLVSGCSELNIDGTNRDRLNRPTDWDKLIADYNSGISAYANHCASCHGTIEGSAKRNRQAVQIQNAIASQSRMAHLKTLSTNDILKIELALSDNVKKRIDEYLKGLPPPEPTSFVATAVSETRIDLAWTSAAGSTSGFRISYQSGENAPDHCSAGTVIKETEITGTSHVVEGLLADTQYSFRVCSINSSSPQLVSSGVLATTKTLSAPPPPPPDPIGLQAAKISSKGIDLSWVSGGGTTVDYRISYQLGSKAPADCASGTIIGETEITGASHSVADLSSLTTYSFRVCAINGDLPPAVSPGIVLTATTNPPPPPDPANPSATAVSATEIKLGWTSGGGTTSDFRISYQTGDKAPPDCNTGSLVSETEISGETHSVTGLQSDTLFSFRICAINGSNPPETSPGIIVSARTLDEGILALIEKYNRGMEIYNTNCSSCHGLVAVSTKRNKKASEILDAISSQPAMAHLKSLPTSDVQLIELALSDEVKRKIDEYLKGGKPDNFVTDYRPLIGTRFYLSSVFQNLFVAPEDRRTPIDKQILKTIDQLLTFQTASLGGPCRRYETICPGDTATNHAAQVLPAANALRKGYILRACEEILASDRAVENALSRADLNPQDAGDPTNIEKTFAVFFPGRMSKSDILSALVEVHASAKMKKMGDVDSWRFVLLSMCKTSVFDLL